MIVRLAVLASVLGAVLLPPAAAGAGGNHLAVAAVEGGYRIRGSPVELGGALSRLDADGYAVPWDQATLASNLHAWSRFFGKLQISHSWTSSRRGVPGADFQETRSTARGTSPGWSFYRKSGYKSIMIEFWDLSEALSSALER